MAAILSAFMTIKLTYHANVWGVCCEFKVQHISAVQWGHALYSAMFLVEPGFDYIELFQWNILNTDRGNFKKFLPN